MPSILAYRPPGDKPHYAPFVLNESDLALADGRVLRRGAPVRSSGSRRRRGHISVLGRGAQALEWLRGVVPGA